MVAGSAGIGAPSAGAGPHARDGAAAAVALVPALELRPGVAGRRRGRGSRGVTMWIRARARVGDAAASKQVEGEGDNEARDVRGGTGRVRLGRGAFAARTRQVRRCCSGGRGTRGMSRCGNERPPVWTSILYRYRSTFSVKRVGLCEPPSVKFLSNFLRSKRPGKRGNSGATIHYV